MPQQLSSLNQTSNPSAAINYPITVEVPAEQMPKAYQALNDRLIKINRELSQFSGDQLIIGCGHQPRHNTTHTFESAYTIDKSNSLKPDMMVDAASPIIRHIPELLGRFNLIVCERLPFKVFERQELVTNIHLMLADSGYCIVKSQLDTLEAKNPELAIEKQADNNGLHTYMPPFLNANAFSLFFAGKQPIDETKAEELTDIVTKLELA